MSLYWPSQSGPRSISPLGGPPPRTQSLGPCWAIHCTQQTRLRRAKRLGTLHITVQFALLAGSCHQLRRARLIARRLTAVNRHMLRKRVVRLVDEEGCTAEASSEMFRGEWARLMAIPSSIASQGNEWEAVGTHVDVDGDESVGPVRFEQITKGDSGRDMVLYLPSVDFTGILAAPQFLRIAQEGWQLWRCFVRSEDRRTTFAELRRGVETWIRSKLRRDRRVVIVGEGFGGLLALALALQLGKALKGIVLVNPATSFRQSMLALLQRRAGSSAGSVLDQFLVKSVGRDVGSAFQFIGSLGRIKDNDGRLAVRAAAGAFGARSVVASSLAGTLSFRLRAWLRDGLEAVDGELRRGAQQSPLAPALLLCSTEDRIFPSRSEAERLRPLLEARCGANKIQIKMLEGIGHEALADSSIDLVALIRDSPIYRPSLVPDYVGDFKFPSLEQIEKGSEDVERSASLLSPVFCSTGPSGTRSFGLSGVPTPTETGGRPVLLVGNHQLLGLDLGPLVREFLIEKGIVVRGLAYPPAFQRQEARSGRRGENQGTFETFGAVPVSPRNIYRLLKRNEAVLLFPGGVREAMHGPGEEYRLFWPAKTDFIRVAARFDATVVPFGGIGVDDSFLIFGKSDKVLEPLRSLRQRRAREEPRGGGLLPVSEALQTPMSFPLLAPQVFPAGVDSSGFGDRYYLSFGAPVDLQDVDPKDRLACANVYHEIQRNVESEISWLLEARLRDPFRDFTRRQLYERLANIESASRRIQAGPFRGEVVRSYGKRAPAFPLK